MKIKNIILAVIMIFACGLTGCRANKEPVPTPRPTTSPLLRKIPTEPFNTPTPVSIAPQTELSSGLLIYPGGAFQLSVPEGWNQEISEYGSAFLSEPDGEGAIYITVTNTGYALDSQAFDQFLNAREQNFFAGFSGYQEISREINDTHDYDKVEKKVIFNEIQDTVDTYYFRNNQAIYVIDFWMETENEQTYRTMYQPMITSFQMDSEVVKDFILYNFIFEFRDSMDEFSFEVPISWLYETTTREGMIIDQFTAPDNQSYFQHIIFYAQDGDTRNAIIEKIFQANQAVFSVAFDENLITMQQDREDGSTYLQWQTMDSLWQFETVYFEMGGKVYALSGLIQNDYLDIYQSTIDYGFEWYAVPAAP